MDNLSFLIEPAITPVFELDGSWNENTAILEGIPAYAFSWGNTTFNIGSDKYAIINTNGAPLGLKWNSITQEWDIYNDISIGLDSYSSTTHPMPTAFYYNNDLYIITGLLNNGFKAYKWSGSAWVVYTNMKWGLSTTTDSNRLAAFYHNSDLYLINGQADGSFNGYKHNGTNWSENNDIINGLTAIGTKAAPCVFTMNNILFMICGRLDGTFIGWRKDGLIWIACPEIVANLPDIGMYSTPHAFELNSDLYLLAMNNQVSIEGFKWTNN